MGLSDRDYMKRPSEDDGERGASPDAKLEALLSGFLSRHPRFFITAGVGLAVLILVSILVAKITDKGR